MRGGAGQVPPARCSPRLRLPCCTWACCTSACRSAHPEDRSARGARQPRALRDQVGVLAADPQHVAPAVGDHQDGGRRREVVGTVKEVDAGLQDRAAAPLTRTRPAISVGAR